MKSLAASTTVGGGREIGPLATAGRAAGGLLLLAAAIVPDDISAWDVIGGIVALPLVAAVVAWLVRLAYRRRAPEHLTARHALAGPGLWVLGLVIAIATALTFVTPIDAPAIWLFFGVSMLVAAVRGQGGCEVVALPNVLFGREDRVSCVLYGPLDAVESAHRLRKGARSVEGRRVTAPREIAVEVLCVAGCPHCQTLLGGVEALLADAGLPARVELRRVRSSAEARALRFLGSPTLRVDGRDVEPTAELRTDYGIGCRLYWSDGAASGRPRDALVLRALQAAAAGPGDPDHGERSTVTGDEFGRLHR